MTSRESSHDKAKQLISATLFVPAQASDIFELLANPAMHKLIDGSNTVRSTIATAPQRLSLGTTFGMKMKFGVKYKITNTVVEFTEGKQIGWRHFGGHVWRYILEPVDGGTNVTEQFSYSTSGSPLSLKMMGYMSRNEKSINQTLANLVKHFSSTK